MKFNQSAIAVACYLALILPATRSFTIQSSNYVASKGSYTACDSSVNVQSNENQDISTNLSRSKFLSSIMSSSAAILLQSTVSVPNAMADDTEEVVSSPPVVEEIPSSTPTVATPPPQPATLARTIEGCPKPSANSKSSCISTANIKQLDLYTPPWTYQVSPDEAFARLKGLVSSNKDVYTIVEVDEVNMYLKVDVKRSFAVQDVLEFLVNPTDKVITFKTYEKDSSTLSDFGGKKKYIDDLRLKSNGVFTVMGGGLTADSYDGGANGKRNGPLGQLKAFYGLQSGEGYQDLYEE